MRKVTEEKKLTLPTKRLLWEFSLYWKLMRIDEIND